MRAPRRPLRVEALEDRTTPAVLSDVGTATLTITLNNTGEEFRVASNGTTYAFTSNIGFIDGGVASPGADFSSSGTTLDLLASGLARYDTINVVDVAAGTSVTFADSGANPYTDSFAVTLDDPAAGTIAFTGNSTFAGTAALSATTTRNIALTGTGTVSTVNGNLTLSANRQAVATTGNFIGVNVNSTVESTGTGVVSVRGRGGDDAAGNQHGIAVRGSVTIRGGTAGTTLVDGIGGASTAVNNLGVLVNGNTSVISSNGSNVSVTGVGGGTGPAGIINRGVTVDNGATITAGGAGTVTVTGTGGGGFGTFSIGVFVTGSSTITSGGGAVTVTGIGTGGGFGGSNFGVEVNGTVTSTGAVTVNGTGGGGAGNNNDGVRVSGTVSTTGVGSTLTVTGTGGVGGGGLGSEGIALEAGAAVTATDADVTLVGDSMFIDATATATAGGAARTATVRPRTAAFGVQIGTGASDAAALGLDDAELARITAATLRVGDANTATITVVGDVTRAAGTLSLTAADVTGAGNIDPGAGLTVTNTDTTCTGSVLSGVISGAAATFTKAGAGTLTLTGENTYGGTTTVAAGTLQVGAGGTTGTLGTGAVTNNGTLVFDRSDDVAVPNAIGGTGGVTQSGAGPTALTGANTYSGTTTIAAGRALHVGQAGTTGSLGTGPVTNNGTLWFTRTDTTTVPNAVSGTGGVTVLFGTVILTGANSYQSVTSVSGGSTLRVGNGGTAGTLGTGLVSNNGTLVFNRSNALTVPNVMNGTGALVQAGTGTTTLTGANTTNGPTTISAGALQVGNGGTTGTLGTGPVTNNGTLVFNRSDTIFVDNAIGGPGGLVKRGPGVMALTGANTYSGTTTIEAGGLQIGRVANNGATGALGTGPVVIAGGYLGFARSPALVVPNPISGPGRLAQFLGTVTLTGTVTHTGETQIDSGATLRIGAGGTTGALGTGEVFGSGTLVFDRSDALTVVAAITGGVSVRQEGTGTTTLTGANTSTGATTITAGTLLLNGSLAGATPVAVTGPGALGGSGSTPRPVTVAAGAFLLPGSETAFGTLSTGDVTFAAGSFFGVKVGGPAQLDRLSVTGAVTLGGATLFIPPTGNVLTPGSSVVVVQNDGTDAVVGTFAGLPEGGTVLADDGTAYAVSYAGGDGNDVTLTALQPAPPPPTTSLPSSLLVTGPGGGNGLLFAASGGKYAAGQTVALIPGFGGEVRVALADVDGDGTPDFVAGTGPGDARVRVVSGANGAVLADFSAFPGYAGGVFVAAGDLNGDGKADIAVTPDAADAFSGPVPDQLPVRVYSGAGFAALAAFDGLASLSGLSGQNNPLVKLGGRPAIADVNGDGTPDLLIAAGSGGGPRVTVWNGTGFPAAAGGKPTANPIANLFVFESGQRGGAFVTAGDINGDGRAEIAVGGGPGGGPRLRIVNSAVLLGLANLEGVDLDDSVNLSNGLVLNNFFAGSESNRGGVRVAVRDVDGDGRADVVTGSGTGELSAVRVYSAASLAAAFGSSSEPGGAQVFDPFGAVLAGGVWVG